MFFSNKVIYFVSNPEIAAGKSSIQKILIKIF
jgi:hypothetical protein